MSLIGVILQQLQGIRENGWDDHLKETLDFSVIYKVVVPNMDDTIPSRGRSRVLGS